VAEVVLGGLLHLLQDHRRDLGRGVGLPLHLDGGEIVLTLHDLVGDARGLGLHLGHLPAHEALDREDGVLGVGHGLTLRDLADEALAVLAEADHGGRGPTPFRVRDDDGVAPLHDGDDRVGRAEVDTDHLVWHVVLSGVFVW
jgi:hypothetical protein